MQTLVQGRSLAIVGLTALSYLAMFALNNALFSNTQFSNGAHYVFLPSGLRFAFVLIFVEQGAIGIACGTALIAYHGMQAPGFVAVAMPALISGFSPWLARLICADRFGLDVELGRLSAQALIKSAAVFAITSALLHQLWYFWQGQTANFLQSTAVMAVGDLTGTILVLYAVKGLLALLPRTLFERR